MITDKKWKELVEKWEKIGPVYQIPRRSRDRLKHFCDNCVPLLKGLNVLEIGANAGVFGYCIAGEAKSYIGVEPGNKISQKKKNKTDYFKQAVITEKECDNMGFINVTVKELSDYKKLTFDSLVMCYALYHLSDKEIDLLKEKILPHCDLVIIQNREQKRKTKHNSYKFWKSKKVVKFFEKQGYNVEVIWGEDRGVKKAFSEIICKKGGARKIIDDVQSQEWYQKSGEPIPKELVAEEIDIDYSKIPKKKSVKGKPETILDKQGGLVPKKKPVKKKVTKKVIKKDETNGKNKTDNTGEAPVSGGRSSSDRQGSVDKGN